MNKKHNSAYFKKDCYFCTQENELDMTTLQLNEALFHELNIIVSDEEMMKEAIKALRLIVLNWGKIAPEKSEEEHGVGLPDAIKQMRGVVAFTPEEIDSDDRLLYLHSK